MKTNCRKTKSDNCLAGFSCITFSLICPSDAVFNFRKFVSCINKEKSNLTYALPALFFNNSPSVIIRTLIPGNIYAYPQQRSVRSVTDLKPGYDTVMSELGFVHQHSTFHFLQRVWDKIFKHIDKKTH